jgi:hypothetical protein
MTAVRRTYVDNWERRCRWLGRSARKYLITKAPSRAASGPPQLRQVTSRSFAAGAASTRTTLYFAPQCGQCIGAGGRDFMWTNYRLCTAAIQPRPIQKGPPALSKGATPDLRAVERDHERPIRAVRGMSAPPISDPSRTILTIFPIFCFAVGAVE